MTVCWTGSRMTGSSKLRSFEDLTVGDKRFFCLWNQFMLDRGYIGSVARVHMTSLLDRFAEEIGREVMEGKLYRQFVLHLVQLEREAVLSKGEVLMLVCKMQKVGQHNDVIIINSIFFLKRVTKL